jgi:diguanylate cyclase (GGDEF)-like protein
MAGLLGAALGQQLEIDRRRQLEEELGKMARLDPLTSLPNRRLFLDRLEQALARHARTPGAGLALLYFDIDKFKNVNDELGHAAGDALLTGFAIRVKALVRDIDTFARYGGDEFVLLLEDVSGSSAEIVAEKILAVTHSYFQLERCCVRVTSSIGVATLAPGDAATPEGFLRQADAAMYEAKRLGRNAFRSIRAGAGGSRRQPCESAPGEQSGGARA